MIIADEATLRELYGWPKGRAKTKVLTSLEEHAIRFIKTSPFLVLSTYSGSGTADASPRGGEPGFVQILDEKTLLMPDAKGNNRADSLVNIIETGHVGCLFFIPGIDETLRINGTAKISINPEYLARYDHMLNKPRSCLVITIDELFLHCAKAFMRSKLWGSEYRVERPGFPTLGKMLNDQIGLANRSETQEEMVERYKKGL